MPYPIPRPSPALRADVYEQDGRSYLVVRDRNGVTEMLCIPGGSEADVRATMEKGEASMMKTLREECRHHHTLRS